jgi:DNA polymerase-1
MLYFIGPYQTRYTPAELNDVIRFMEREDKFCFDTETTGLDPHRSKVIMIQIGNEEFQFVIDARHVDVTPLLPYLESRDKMKIGSNLAFDYKMMLGNYGIRMQNLGDTMIREKVLETGRKTRGFGLKDLAKKYLKVNMPKEVRTEFTRIHNEPFDDRQILYGGNDGRIGSNNTS